METVYINGRFLTQKITGVQRFAGQIVYALDKILTENDKISEVVLIAPAGTPAPDGLSHIKFKAYGALHGHLWEQICLPYITRNALLVNFGSSGPILKRRQFTIIHDAAVHRKPQNYSLVYGTVHRIIGRMLANFSTIGTVSAFSRAELAEIFNLQEKNIEIIGNGHEHLLSVASEDAVLERLGLRNNQYFLFVGSTTPNKNLARAIDGFNRLGRPEISFVIIGGTEKAIYKSGLIEKPPNVLLPGRLSDGEIASLYRHAAALVFPSIYEGFGIPPLEAMTLKCPVIASSIPPIKEVCGDAALYFDPYNSEEITACMKTMLNSQECRAQLIQKGLVRYQHFSWKKSASRLSDILLRLQTKSG